MYLDSRARELENLTKGLKTMIIRGAMGRKVPHGRVAESDHLFFIENKGDGLVKAKAVVETVFHSGQLSKEQSAEIVEQHQDQLKLNDALKKRFAGKRYLVLITLKDFQEVEPFKIDRSSYGNMDDWLPVGNIEPLKNNSENDAR